jgi:hypothetical protein
MGIYVDDLIITGNDDVEINNFKLQMSAKFKMCDLGLLSFYLGINVKHGSDGINMSQAVYVHKILEHVGMGSCNSCYTPMEHRLKLSNSSVAPSVDATEYRGIIGFLHYLLHTRLDIAFAIGYVSRFMESPTTEHLNAVKRVLCYVAGTIDFGYNYHCGGKELWLFGYSDADMGGDVDTRMSTTDVVFFLGSSPATWQSQKQKVVALSSCEAEYTAGMMATCQGIWLAWLLVE